MKITRDNYESYFLDYLEGNLDEGMMDEFVDFLQKNPDLKDELQLGDSITLIPDDVIYEDKSGLIRHKFDLPEEFNKAAVARIEGDLNPEEKAVFEAWLSKNPAMREELSLFESTRLRPDPAIVYSRKENLYHISRGKTILLWSTRIAAVLILAFMVYNIAVEMAGVEGIVEQEIIVTENKNEKPEQTAEPKSDVKKESPAPAEEKSLAPAKKAGKSVQPAKSLRENNKGRMDHEKVAVNRLPVDVPDMLPPRQASLETGEIAYASLEPVKINYNIPPEVPAGERLVGDILRQKVGIDNLSVGKVARVGLNIVASLSGDKFSYETNNEGQITELNYDSRLLAFSIPTNPEN